MSEEPEELVEDDEVITNENDPTSTSEVQDDEIPSEGELDDNTELSTLQENNQLSGEEDVVASGEDIIQHLPQKQVTELQYIKEVFPHIYKRTLEKYTAEFNKKQPD